MHVARNRWYLHQNYCGLCAVNNVIIIWYVSTDWLAVGCSHNTTDNSWPWVCIHSFAFTILNVINRPYHVVCTNSLLWSPLDAGIYGTLQLWFTLCVCIATIFYVCKTQGNNNYYCHDIVQVMHETLNHMQWAWPWDYSVCVRVRAELVKMTPRDRVCTHSYRSAPNTLIPPEYYSWQACKENSILIALS